MENDTLTEHLIGKHGPKNKKKLAIFFKANSFSIGTQKPVCLVKVCVCLCITTHDNKWYSDHRELLGKVNTET